MAMKPCARCGRNRWGYNAEHCATAELANGTAVRTRTIVATCRSCGNIVAWATKKTVGAHAAARAEIPTHYGERGRYELVKKTGGRPPRPYYDVAWKPSGEHHFEVIENAVPADAKPVGMSVDHGNPTVINIAVEHENFDEVVEGKAPPEIIPVYKRLT